MLHTFKGSNLRWVTVNTRRSIRFNSTIFGSLRKGIEVPPEDLHTYLTSNKLTEEDVEKIHEIVKAQEASANIINKLLKHGLQEDFSLYYTVNRANPSHVWDNESLCSLIENNPGRAVSLWALFDKYRAKSDQKVVRAVIDKLLGGEKAELREGAVEITADRLDRAIKLMNLVDDIAEKQWELLIQKAGDLELHEKLAHVEGELFSRWLNEKLASVTDKREFLNLSRVIFNKDAELLSKESISRILKYSQFETKPEIGSKYLSAVIDHVEQNHLDIDKKDPESLLIRLELVTAYGIQQDDFNKALEKFHAYQTHEKFGIELVQAKLVQVFGYQAFKKGDKTLLRIAETLVDPEELQVKTLAQLILARARFNAEDSLNLYNDYINKVPKKVNENTGRSPSGVLTEALMVANLYNNDREFAHLLYDKAIASGFLIDEAENAQIKKVFKVYGDSFEESDKWESAQPRIGEFVLGLIRRE